MAGKLFKYLFETVFMRAVRARISQPVALVYKNGGAHDQLKFDRVKVILLPPKCTSVYKSLDLGIIACLTKRCTRRLLDLVVHAF